MQQTDKHIFLMSLAARCADQHYVHMRRIPTKRGGAKRNQQTLRNGLGCHSRHSMAYCN